MPRTETITVYKFSELTEAAQDAAIDKLWDINVDYDWWQHIYDVAERIGLKITEFDCDRYARGNLSLSGYQVCRSILREHGKDCETYKTARGYIREYAMAFTHWHKSLSSEEVEDYGKLANAFDVFIGEDPATDIDSELTDSLLEDYRIILRNEYEYLTSREAIFGTVECSDYDFTADGSLYQPHH